MMNISGDKIKVTIESTDLPITEEKVKGQSEDQGVKIKEDAIEVLLKTKELHIQSSDLETTKASAILAVAGIVLVQIFSNPIIKKIIWWELLPFSLPLLGAIIACFWNLFPKQVTTQLEIDSVFGPNRRNDWEQYLNDKFQAENKHKNNAFELAKEKSNRTKWALILLTLSIIIFAIILVINLDITK